jgi:hypothetical protein
MTEGGAFRWLGGLGFFDKENQHFFRKHPAAMLVRRAIRNENAVTWFISDFLIHLYYSSFKEDVKEEKPWFEELELKPEEVMFFKKLMGIEDSYKSIDEIKDQLEKIKL